MTDPTTANLASSENNSTEDELRLELLLDRIHNLTSEASGPPSAAPPAVQRPVAQAPVSQPPNVQGPNAQASVASPAGPANITSQPQPGALNKTPPTNSPIQEKAPVLNSRPSVSASMRLIEEGGWFPPEPASFKEAGISGGEVENLVLKVVLSVTECSGRDLSEMIKIPFRLIDPMMHSLKADRMVAHKGSAMMNDYTYQLTDLGVDRAKKLLDHTSYRGSTPVTLDQYIASVGKQSLAHQHPSEEDLKRAFSDLLIEPEMLKRLGPAVNSGRGMFLFGYPGNGKTSIAERVTKAFGQFIWVPRAISIDGEIMRFFDPSVHEEAPIDNQAGLLDDRRVDNRWVRIRRPTIVVGGELTMDALEVTLNTITNVSEAPVQMKSNCGTLVIDDFGRQRMTTDELLNRWIVPLEKRYDYLSMASGKKIQVPFDQLIIFSTNLEPKDLVDDAFLRRIPYKIEVEDPLEGAFRELFKIMSPIIGVEYDEESVSYLIKTHYLAVKRPFRCCQPRDLLLQIKNYSHYVRREPVMSRESIDFAVDNYFAVM